MCKVNNGKDDKICFEAKRYMDIPTSSNVICVEK